MTGKSATRVLFVFALLPLSAGFAINSATAATNVYLDVNGASAGDGSPNNAIYPWSTTVANWNTNNAANNTTAPADWAVADTEYFGGFNGDVLGWSYTMAADNNVMAMTGAGINVGSIAAGSVILTNTAGASPNFYIKNAMTWTVAAGSSLIDNINGTGCINLNSQTLTLTGAGNVTFGGAGLLHTGSTVTDNLTGVCSITAAAQVATGNANNNFNSTSTFNWNGGTLALGNATGLGSANFVIGNGSSTGLNLSNISAGAMTLNSTGSVTIKNSFTFTGGNDFAFGSGAVTLNTSPTITIASNTLTFPQPIGGTAFGINMVGPGTMALNAANTYGGGTTISNGTLSMGANGALGSGGVSVQPGGILAVTAAVTGQLGNGNVTIQPGGLVDTTALGATGYTMNGGVLTAGDTASFPTDINGTINLNNTALNINGGTAAVGTLTVNGGLGLSGGTLNYLAGDQISLSSNGALSLSNTAYIVPNTALTAGTYTVFSNFTGLTGGGTLAMAGAFGSSPRQMYAFNNTGNSITLTVSGSAGNLFWTGGSNSTWDNGVSQSWFNANTSAADYFYTGDNVTFNDTPGTAATVNLNDSVQPGSFTVSNTAVAYTLTGTGSIGGTTSLQMNGQGTFTIANSNGNSYSGGTFLSSGVLNANVANALGAGPVSVNGGLLNLGNAGALGPGTLTLTSGSIDNTSGSAATLAGNNPQNWNGSFTFIGSNPLNLGTGAVALSNNPTVTVNAGTLTVGGVMSGATSLTVAGGTAGGVLLSTTANTYTGATTINNGATFQLGTGQAGQDGSLAAGGVNVNVGAAIVYDIAGPQTAAYTFTGAGSLVKLGSGTLTLSVASTNLTGTTSVNGGILALTAAGGNGTILKSPIVVASAGTLELNSGGDNLGYNAGGAPVTIYGTMIKTGAESETLARLITLSGGTMNATATGGVPNGSWDLEGPGPLVSTAPGTTNFIMGAGTTENISARNAGAYFNIGANSTLNVSVPFLQNSNGGSSPNVNITGPGNMIFSGTNYYGTGGTAATINVGFATTGTSGTAGNLVLAGSLTFPITTAPATIVDGKFNVGFGSTLTISNSANVFVLGDLKLGTTASGSSGTANQTGGTLAVLGVDANDNNRSLVIGEQPSETSAYNLSAGSLSVPNGWTYLGYSGSGVFNMSGGTATLLGINFGSGQGGALNLAGGLLSIGTSGISNNNVNSSASISGGTLQTAGNWNTGVPIALNGPATLGLQNNSIGLNGAISGSGGLSLIGPGGTLLLGGSNSYSGGTTVPAGFIVRAGANNALGTGLLYLNGGGVSANGASAYSLASPLVLSGGTLGDTVNNGALNFTAAAGTLAQNVSLAVNSPVTISGGLTDGGGGFALTKNGPGALTLAGNNTFSGSTSVNAGGLYVNGTNATPSIFVASGSTLGGAGSAVSANVTVGDQGILDLSQNASSTLTFASMTFNNRVSINLPSFTGTSTLALQAGALTTNGFGNSVQFNFPQTNLNAGTYRLLDGYVDVLSSDGTATYSVPNPPPLGFRQSGGLVFNGSEIDYAIVGFTPYWNGQQSDWQSGNAWTLNPGGTLTTFHAGDNDVFDDSGATGAVGTNVNINMGNVRPISVTFNNVTSAYTISGSNGIVGPTSVQINGSGGLTINNSNSYSGGTQFYAGTLNVNNSSAIGSGILTISAGTLGNTSGGPLMLATNNVQSWNGDFTFNGPYDLNLGTGAVTLSGSRSLNLAAGNLTVGGAIGGTGASLTVIGTGGLVLGGANTYNSGTFILGSNNVTASDPNSPLGSGPVSVSPSAGSATLTLTGSAATIGALTISPTSATATVTLSGAAPTTGAVTMSPLSGADTATLNLPGAAPTIGALSSSGAGTSMIVLGNAANSSATSLTVNQSTSTTFSGTIADLSQTNPAAIGSLVLNGPATLTLSGSNTYTGSTTVSSGVLQLGSNSALYAGAGIGNAIVNGTLDLNGYNASVGALSGGGNVLSSVAGASTLTAGNNNASSTYSGTLQASLQGLAKTGSGILVLTGQDNSPNTTVSQGTLQFNTAPAVPASGNVSANGTFVENCLYFPLTLTGTGAWVVNATNGGATAGGLNFGTNNAATCNETSFTGTTYIMPGNRYWLNNINNVPGGPIVVESGAQFGDGIGGPSVITVNLFIAGSTWQGTGGDANGALRLNSGAGSGNTVAGSVTLMAAAGIGTNAPGGTAPGTGTVSANITGNYPLTIVNGIVTLSGTGNSFGSLVVPYGATDLGCGVIAGAGDNAAFGGGGLSVSGTVQVNGNSLTNASLSGAATGLVINGPTAFQLGSLTVGTDNTSTTFAGTIADGNATNPLSLTKTGTGTLQLSGNNTYTGGTDVTGGVLQMGSAAAIGTGALAVDGGSLDLAGYSVTVPSFSGAAGTVTTSVTGLATVAVNQTVASTTFGGTISDGAGQLALNLGSGTLTLSGTGAYTGGTYVEGTGNLIVTSPSAIDINGLGTNLFVGNPSELSLFGGVVPADAGVPAGSATAAVPEPATLALLAAGGAAAVLTVRRNRRTGRLRKR